MRKFLLLMLTLGLSSQVVLAQDATQVNDEDSFQGTTPAVAAPQQADTADTIDVAPEAPAPTQTQVQAQPQVQQQVQQVQQVQQAPAPVVVQEVAPAPAPVKVASVSSGIQQQQQEAIDINALYRTKPAPQVARRPMTEAEKMKLMRAKLEKQNEILMKKQMERMRMKQELEMSKRIQKTFEDSMKKLEETN